MSKKSVIICFNSMSAGVHLRSFMFYNSWVFRCKHVVL